MNPIYRVGRDLKGWECHTCGARFAIRNRPPRLVWTLLRAHLLLVHRRRPALPTKTSPLHVYVPQTTYRFTVLADGTWETES